MKLKSFLTHADDNYVIKASCMLGETFFVTFNLKIFETFPPSASDALGKVLQTSLKFRNDAGIRDKCDGGWKKRGKTFC